MLSNDQEIAGFILPNSSGLWDTLYIGITVLCIRAEERKRRSLHNVNPYPTAFPYGNGMVLHFYQQQESSTTKTVHKVINKGLKTYV